MSISTDNSGLVIFGTCDDGQPTDAGVSFPTTSGQCFVTVKYKSGAKTKKASASGKPGAKTTFAGKQVGEIEIDIEWLDDGADTTTEVEAGLEILARGHDTGKVWDYTGRWASIHKIGALMLEEIDGPNPAKNSDVCTAKIKCSAWEKPVNSGAGASATPAAASPYNANGTVKTPGFPGSENVAPLASSPVVTP